MGNALVERYLSERESLLNTVNTLKMVAMDREKDPSPEDLEVMQNAYKRIDVLDGFIKVVGEERAMDEETRLRLMQPMPEITSNVHYRTGGEMLWDCIHATYGQAHVHEDQEAKRRWDVVMKRAAQHMGTDAAKTTPTAGGIGGLFVQPVVGPVIDLYPSAQPFLDAIGRQPAPGALTFVRPRIVDPDFATGAAIQTLQKAELASKKFDVKVDTLTLTTVGGYLNVSQQLMSLQPSGWDIIVGQLQKRVAYQGELAAITELAKTTATVTLAAGATPQATIAALFQAAKLVYDNTRELPTWIAYGPGGWAMLGSLCDSAGRPLFPFLGAANAMGTANLGDFNLGPLGLRQIVTPAITDNTIYVGNNLALEAYVYSFPVMSALEPSLMGTQVAVAEAWCFYRPTTGEGPPAVGNGAVKVGPAGP